MPAVAKVTPTGNGDPPAQEDAMTFKFSAATKLLSLAAVGVLAIGLGATQADAQTKRKPTNVNSTATTNGNSSAYGPAGPNRSYQSGRTRVFVTTRSWLDAGVEVLPGDRKFSDYAFPQSRSFAQENLNRPLDRQPLYPAYDLGGYPQGIPLY
jgi:hypothetical protein